jgi:hypothetical protein
MEERLTLVSPFNPEAAFDVGNAMARNRYIYCLADAAVVVTTSEGQGGTWNGAIQNLKQGWVPLWTMRGSEGGSGNSALVARGGCWLPESFRVADLSCPEGDLVGSESNGDEPRLNVNKRMRSAGARGQVTQPTFVPGQDVMAWSSRGPRRRSPGCKEPPRTCSALVSPLLRKRGCRPSRQAHAPRDPTPRLRSAVGPHPAPLRGA